MGETITIFTTNQSKRIDNNFCKLIRYPISSARISLGSFSPEKYQI